MEKYTYLFINLASILFPLLFSFDKKVAFYKTWSRLLPAIAMIAFLFIAWDIVFTAWKIWSFNPKYLMGITIINLPIEEYMFFFCVPYSCVFIYECYNVYFPNYNPIKDANKTSVFLACFLLIVGLCNIHRSYTFYTCLFASLLLQLHIYFFKGKYLGRFYIAYLIILIPFLIINGLLTALPVVQYNDAENLGYKLFTIPVEDIVYGMLNVLGVVTIMEETKDGKSVRDLIPV